MKPRRTTSAAPRAEFEGYDLRAIQRRFLAINEARLRRTREILRPRHRDFLYLLPLLFDVDHPQLPGWQEGGAPGAVAGYTPDANAIDAARRVARGFQFPGRADGPAAIRGIYCMGSPGSVAFTADSDFDIWLCHDPALDAPALERLQSKATAIENWAATLDLEVHFFLFDVDRFRTGAPVAISSESSGTAQHLLLLEEFYRTGLLVAGQYPLWWLVPPEREREYAFIASLLREKDFLQLGEALDFGGLAQLPPAEFSGAALWQLSKGIGSPYKAVLKLFLIEAYASEYPAIELLSQRLKQAVYRDEEALERYDPYLAMLRKVEEYLQQRRERPRLDLARRCFYLKVGTRLSEPVRGATDWRREVVGETIREWGWSPADLLSLDRRGEWDIPRLADERNLLFEALTGSYRFLTSFARRFAAEASISQRDLTILGRKLFAAYERKAGKLDLVNRGEVGRDMREARYTLAEVADGPGSIWSLYQGAFEREALARRQPLKRTRGLVELIAWAYFNRLLAKRTSVSVYPRDGDFTGVPLAGLLHHLEEHLPLDRLDCGEVDEYARPAKVAYSTLFINTGAGAAPAPDDDDGRADPLCFGPRAVNLLRSIDAVQMTTWREVLHQRHVGADALFDGLCDHFKWWPLNRGERPTPIRATGLTAQHGAALAQRVEELFGDLAACFYADPAGANARYVVESGGRYTILAAREEVIAHTAVEGYAALLDYLGRPQARYSPIVIDRRALPDSPLRVLTAGQQLGRVQLYYYPLGQEVEIYLLDERGSLFVQRRPFYAPDPLLAHYGAFFSAVQERMGMLLQEGDDTLSPPQALECWAIVRADDGTFARERREPSPPAAGSQDFLSIQALADSDEQGRTVFTLYCDGHEFSSLEYGKRLFPAVVDYVLARRAGAERYPIYITDLSFSRALLGAGGLRKFQSVLFFKYKERIEEQLNRVLAMSK